MSASPKEDLPVILIVTFYLSKYDRQACHALGYNNFRETCQGVGQRLGIKPNTIKNRRDEFDPIHDNGRRGWYQREMRSICVQVIRMFDDLSFEALTGLVRSLLSEHEQFSREIEPMLAGLRACEQKGQHLFAPRGATGRKAEECFMRWFHEGVLPFQGTLVDRRDDGCGYDFLIKNQTSHRIEVKGLAAEAGGILLTDKEWQTARHLKEDYSLFVVNNVDDTPSWTIINNPVMCLTPKMSVRTVVQVNWQVSPGQLASSPQVEAKERQLQ